MRFGYYAGIDIGTNAARLVIKYVEKDEDNEVTANKVQELRIPVRLGVDVFSSGAISFIKEEQIIEAMKAFRSLMNIYNVIDYKAVATSAFREASNGAEIVEKIKKESGIDIKIVSGESEASTTTRIISELKLGDDTYCLIDVGGGSTEVSLIKNKKAKESHSFAIGTIRMLLNKDKKETWSQMNDLLKKYNKEYGDMNIIGTGGNINRYYKMSKHEHDNKKNVDILPVENMISTYESLNKLDVNERQEKYKLKPDRADVIVPAGEIFINAAKILDSKYIMVPMSGLSDAIVNELITNSMNVI